MMIIANGSVQVIEGKVELPLTIQQVTRLCEVRFVEHLDTEMILRLDAQAEFDVYFGSRLKKVFMPDESTRHNPLKTWLVEEVYRFRFTNPQDMHYIDVQGNPSIKQRYRAVSPKVQEAMYQEEDRMLAEGVIKESFSECSRGQLSHLP